jgi:hypothetical protein
MNSAWSIAIANLTPAPVIAQAPPPPRPRRPISADRRGRHDSTEVDRQIIGVLRLCDATVVDLSTALDLTRAVIYKRLRVLVRERVVVDTLVREGSYAAHWYSLNEGDAP